MDGKKAVLLHSACQVSAFLHVSLYSLEVRLRPHILNMLRLLQRITTEVKRLLVLKMLKKINAQHRKLKHFFK